MKTETISMQYLGEIPCGLPGLQRSLATKPILPGEIVKMPSALARRLKNDPNWRLTEAAEAPRKKKEKEMKDEPKQE